VSNRAGTTGMDESRLEMLTRVRHHHLLTPLRAIPAPMLHAVAEPQGPTRWTDEPPVLVRFTGTELGPYELGLPDQSHLHRLRHLTHLIVAEGVVPRHTSSGAA